MLNCQMQRVGQCVNTSKIVVGDTRLDDNGTATVLRRIA